jgi:hypothetical protein
MGIRENMRPECFSPGMVRASCENMTRESASHEIYHQPGLFQTLMSGFERPNAEQSVST